MVDVSTDSYPKPQPPQSPLDQIMKVGQAADTLGHIAVGQGVQQAIQPDGSIDQGVLAQALKGSVAGSMQAIPTLDAAQKLRAAGYSADALGLQNFQTRMDHIGKAAASIIENPSKDGVMKGFGYLLNPNNGAAAVGLGIPQIQAAQKEFYDEKGNMLPPAQIKAAAQRIATQALSSSEAIKAHLQQTVPFDTGAASGETVSTGTPMNPGGFSIAKQPPPTQGTVDTRRTLPTGQPNPNYGQPTILGEQPGAPPNVVRSGPGEQPVRSSYTQGSQVVGVEPPTNAVTGQPIQKPPGFATPTMGLPTATPPGFSTATDVGATNSGKMAAELQTANNEAPATKAIIGNLEKESKNFTQGPGADYKRIAKSFAVANLPIPSSLKQPGAMFDPESIADQESFNKNIYNLVQSQFKALGGTGTDSKLESASHTSPSELMSAVGTKNILALLKGNQDAIQAKTKAWNDWQAAGNGPQTYPQFAQQFNDNFDPRVFQFKYMTPAQRQDYYNKIDNPDERRELKRRIEYAIDNKMVKY